MQRKQQLPSQTKMIKPIYIVTYMWKTLAPTPNTRSSDELLVFKVLINLRHYWPEW